MKQNNFQQYFLKKRDFFVFGMEEKEEKIWADIVTYRTRAKELLRTGEHLEDKVNIDERLDTLIKLEDHLLWSWKRLDMDLKKGDPSLLITQEQRALAAMNFIVNEHTVSVSHT